VARSDYLDALRTRVGRQLLLLPSVTLCIFDGERRILLVRHVDSGSWGTPGGMIEPDERPADAVVREGREELGVMTSPTDLIGVFGGPEFRFSYANGDEVAYVMSAFHCRLDGPPAPDGDEISDAAYVSSEEWRGMPVAPWLHAALPQVFSWIHAGDGLALFDPASTREDRR
jgi:ADP-ribose pyrophosphatase YjhB (NUDIX family)